MLKLCKPRSIMLALLLGFTAGSAFAAEAKNEVPGYGLAADTPIGAPLFAGSPMVGAMRAGPTRLVALDSGAATEMTRPVRAAIDRALSQSLDRRGLLAPADKAARFRIEPTVYDLTLERSGAAVTLRLAFGYSVIDTAADGQRHNDIFHVRVPVQNSNWNWRSVVSDRGEAHPATKKAIRQALNGVVADLLAYDRRLETDDPLHGFRLD
jgi:hypothetical protein